MNLEQIRARLAEIRAKMDSIQAGSEGYTQEQVDEVNALSEETERLTAQLDTAEKLERAKAATSASAGRQTTGAQASRPNIQVGEDRSRKLHGFESAGQWMMAVKNAGIGHTPDKRLLQNSAARESVGEDGGFLVPEEISTQILKKMEGDDALMNQTNVVQVSGNNLSLTVDEKQPWNGGVTAYWMGEGSPFTESKPSFRQVDFKLQKVGALVKATDELLEDATALESYIMGAAPGALNEKINEAIIAGNGVNKPMGIINSSFAVTVSKESMQSADTVNYKNIAKMYGRMFPKSRGRAAWYINPAVEDQLRLMVDDNGNLIYVAPGGQFNQTPYAQLLGRPVIPLMGGMPALGDLGDIIFGDLSYYYMIRKANGIKSATSIHLEFAKEITSFRFSFRVDGKVPFKSPVSPQNGSYDMSGFVLLEAR